MLELAGEESRQHGQGHVGVEHLLLGLLAQRDGTAAVILSRAGATADAVRAQTTRLSADRRAVSADDAPPG